MAWCGSIVTATHPQTGATYYTVSVEPMTTGEPPVTRDFASCEVVIESGVEVSNWKQMMSLTVDDAQTIGLQIMVVWAIAWGCRAVRMALISPSERYDHE